MLESLSLLFSYDFLRRALIGIVLMMPLFSLLGTLVVNNGMAFFSDALGHSALTGIAVGVVFGFADPEPMMLLFAAVFALLMNAIRHSRLSSTDTVIGVFSSCGVALGLVLLSRVGSLTNYQSLLIGDMLSITDRQLWLLGGTLVVVAVLWLLCFNGFYAVSLNASLAHSKGLKVKWLDNLFVVVLALSVMLAIRWVGLLLINAMLVLPAAAARNVARSMRSYLALTLVFSLFSGVLGLSLSWLNAVAAGPTVVLVSAAVYFGTVCIGKR